MAKRNLEFVQIDPPKTIKDCIKIESNLVQQVLAGMIDDRRATAVKGLLKELKSDIQKLSVDISEIDKMSDDQLIQVFVDSIIELRRPNLIDKALQALKKAKAEEDVSS